MRKILFIIALISGFQYVISQEAPKAGGKISATELTCPGKISYPVHLTFDDGPHSKLTPRILDILKEFKIKATFFVSTEHLTPPNSERARRARELIARAKAEGHQIGSHTHQHIDHASERLSADEVHANLLRSRELLGENDSLVFRFPYGSGWVGARPGEREERVVRARTIAKSIGMKHVGWDIDSWDWSANMRAYLPQSMLWQICNHQGGIVLMHDIQPFTAENLREIIISIQRSGHRIVDFNEIKKYSDQIPGGLNAFATEVISISMCNGAPRDTIDRVWRKCPDVPHNPAFGNSDGGGATK